MSFRPKSSGDHQRADCSVEEEKWQRNTNKTGFETPSARFPRESRPWDLRKFPPLHVPRMPAPKKELPPGECNSAELATTVTHTYKTDFEISSETGKVRCRTCLTAGGYEPWILRSSAQAHLKSEHHHERETAKKRYEETQERLNQTFHRDAERSAAMWDTFLAPEVIPSIQVNPRETIAPVCPVPMVEEHEQEEWLRDFINCTEDASRPEADGRDRSLDEWLAATFGEAILLGQDEDDETVTNVLNAACSSFP